MWATVVALAGVAIGAGMGLYALVNPRWASRLVRLGADPARPGGFAEFRGTYGGLFFASHATAGVLLGVATFGPPAAAGAFTGLYFPAALGALLACAAIWVGTAAGRLLSMALDRTATGFNLASVGFELALGIALSAPVWSAAF